MKRLYVFALAMAICLGNAGVPAAGDWVPSGANMYYTGGNIGIGTTTPEFPLQVVSNTNVPQVLRVEGNALTDGSTAFMRNYNSASTGNVLFLQNHSTGYSLLIDSLSPDTAGDVLIKSDTKTGQVFRINGDFLTTGTAAFIRNYNRASTGKAMYLQNLGTGNALYVRQDNSGRMVDLGHYPNASVATPGDATALYIDVSNPIGNSYALIVNRGNVGIGTTSPQSKLAVNGTVTAKEVVVTLTGWADHVFKDDYKLMPLNELEKTIKTDRHLPGIPSADEVKQNGVSIGDMQAKMLAKIEELTLHMIEQNKKLEQLASENLILKKEIANLQTPNRP